VQRWAAAYVRVADLESILGSLLGTGVRVSVRRAESGAGARASQPDVSGRPPWVRCPCLDRSSPPYSKRRRLTSLRLHVGDAGWFRPNGRWLARRMEAAGRGLCNSRLPSGDIGIASDLSDEGRLMLRGDPQAL
jgi:hypothetical protein